MEGVSSFGALPRFSRKVFRHEREIKRMLWGIHCLLLSDKRKYVILQLFHNIKRLNWCHSLIGYGYSSDQLSYRRRMKHCATCCHWKIIITPHCYRLLPSLSYLAVILSHRVKASSCKPLSSGIIMMKACGEDESTNAKTSWRAVHWCGTRLIIFNIKEHHIVPP